MHNSRPYYDYMSEMSFTNNIRTRGREPWSSGQHSCFSCRRSWVHDSWLIRPSESVQFNWINALYTFIGMLLTHAHGQEAWYLSKYCNPNLCLSCANSFQSILAGATRSKARKKRWKKRENIRTRKSFVFSIISFCVKSFSVPIWLH